MSKTKCACGRGKYPDADCCQTCWNKQAGYDERSNIGHNSGQCQCGAGKIADASMCDECWAKQSAYDDGRG
jgi:hypothetical protein